jgi:hypothetical protein
MVLQLSHVALHRIMYFLQLCWTDYTNTRIFHALVYVTTTHAVQYVASNGWMVKNNALLLVCRKEVMTLSKVFYRDTLCQIRILSVLNTNRERERDLLSQVAPRLRA